MSVQRLSPEMLERLSESIITPCARELADRFVRDNDDAEALARTQIEALQRLAEGTPSKVQELARHQLDRSTIRPPTSTFWKLVKETVHYGPGKGLGKNLYDLLLEHGFPGVDHAKWKKAEKKVFRAEHACLIQPWARRFCIRLRYALTCKRRQTTPVKI